jgi:preprotein translocase subunit SecG
MLILLTMVHVVVCIFLIIVVLLQSGKAADLAGAFGGMGSQTAFGPRGSATLLSKATTASAIVFMITSLSLSILATRGSSGAKTVLDSSQGGAQTAPAKSSVPAKGPTVQLPGGKPTQLHIPTPPPGQRAPAPTKK